LHHPKFVFPHKHFHHPHAFFRHKHFRQPRGFSRHFRNGPQFHHHHRHHPRAFGSPFVPHHRRLFIGSRAPAGAASSVEGINQVTSGAALLHRLGLKAYGTVMRYHSSSSGRVDRCGQG
jgi:hypothetical protein